jgi:hypothetical protein
MPLVPDVLSHSFGFLCVVGLWNARQVCRFWLASSRKACSKTRDSQTRVSLRDLCQADGLRLVVRRLLVHDDSSSLRKLKASECLAVDCLAVEILNLEFRELSDRNAPAFHNILDAVMPASLRELRFQFSALNECCDDTFCGGDFCHLLRTQLPKFAHCLVELPWTSDGYLSRDCCFRSATKRPMPGTWRLRGGYSYNSKIMVAEDLFGVNQVKHLVLQDINFLNKYNARALVNLSLYHSTCTSLEFVACRFPEPALWPLYYGSNYRTMFDNFRVQFRQCNISARDVQKLCPDTDVY